MLKIIARQAAIILVAASSVAVAGAASGAIAAPPDYGDHRCYWTPYNQQERGGHDGPWNCNRIVGVSGNSMTLNGAKWRSRGVTLQAFVRPATPQVEQNEYQIYKAHVYYAFPELEEIAIFGADTIRFQVSQPSLDPQSPLYDAGYVKELIAGLKLARQKGFVVMIMMQDETISGETNPQPLATAETMRDWTTLNGIFGQDRGILYELYNEPNLPASTANWALWANGGSTGAGAAPSIGMQTMINELRAGGSQNLFVLDGLHLSDGTQAAATLEGLPMISDPLGRVVYAVHPYAHGMVAGASQWDVRFGNAAKTMPVDADEWSAQAGAALGLGNLPSYGVAVDFLNYVRTHEMSLGAGAFDIPDFMVRDVPGWSPTNYDHYSPSHGQDDAGLLVQRLYRTNYRQPLTAADGVTH